MSGVIEIDGSYLEGGGQILRNALSLSCILRRSIRVINIRANRPNPGLSNQHLFSLNLLKEVTNAHVKGNFIKSTEVEFHPCDIESGNYTIDTRTAASISLVLQAAMPVFLFGRSHTELELFGGTNVPMAPQVDFLEEIVAPNLERFGAYCTLNIIRRGFYPRGGGHCKITVSPLKVIKSAQVTRFGELQKISGYCFIAGNLPVHLAEDMKNVAESNLKMHSSLLSLKYSKEKSQSNGAACVLKAISTDGCVIGSSALGERKIDSCSMGSSAAKDLEGYLKRKTCVDRYVQDQLIIFMALADGVSCISTCELTNHTKTAIHVAEKLAGVQFDVEDLNDGHYIIKCKGLGYVNKNL